MLCERLAGLDFIAGGKAVEVSASFGVARVDGGKQPLAHALAAAEIACKAAKDRGRNRVELYEDSDQSIVRRYTDVTLVGTAATCAGPRPSGSRRSPSCRSTAPPPAPSTSCCCA